MRNSTYKKKGEKTPNGCVIGRPWVYEFCSLKSPRLLWSPVAVWSHHHLQPTPPSCHHLLNLPAELRALPDPLVSHWPWLAKPYSWSSPNFFVEIGLGNARTISSAGRSEAVQQGLVSLNWLGGMVFSAWLQLEREMSPAQCRCQELAVVRRTPMGFIHSGGHLISTESQQKERIHMLSWSNLSYLSANTSSINVLENS